VIGHLNCRLQRSLSQLTILGPHSSKAEFGRAERDCFSQAKGMAPLWKKKKKKANVFKVEEIIDFFLILLLNGNSAFFMGRFQIPKVLHLFICLLTV
jgi:hypothetical protein